MHQYEKVDIAGYQSYAGVTADGRFLILLKIFNKKTCYIAMKQIYVGARCWENSNM